MPYKSKLDTPTLEEYPDWLRDYYDIDLGGGAEERWYEIITPRLRNQFMESALWNALLGRLPDWNNEYKAEHNGYPLVRETIPPDIEIKSYSSTVDKSYRYNVSHNDRWPAPPIPPSDEDMARAIDPDEAGDWYGPDNWFREFPDIIRTRFTVTYMDGVPFLANKLTDLAEELGGTAERRFQARPDGYHAVHVLVDHAFDVFDLSSRSMSSVPARVEIQLTTQIQETISDLLHHVYEKWRLDEPPEGWQWDYASPEFAVNYLGHTLHYLEGMIVVARESQE